MQTGHGTRAGAGAEREAVGSGRNSEVVGYTRTIVPRQCKRGQGMRILWPNCGGVRRNGGEQREGAGGTFGRLPLFHTAPSQGPLDCAHSKARTFKEAWE